MSVAPIDYPVRLGLDAPVRMARWRPFVNWLLAVPHGIITYALGVLREALLFVSFFAVLFTKAIPRPLFDMVAMTYRYQWRFVSYALFLREVYPRFDFTPASEDVVTDPATYAIDYPVELDRWKPLYKWFLAIPHFIVLLGLWIAAFAVSLAAAFVVLFTNEYPQGMRDFVVGVMRWQMRVEAYVLFLTDVYPPFTLHSTAQTPTVALPPPLTSQ
jgi:hypothetical protein